MQAYTFTEYATILTDRSIGFYLNYVLDWRVV